MANLVAIPVYNEERHILPVIEAVRAHHSDIVVVNDGSTDRTAALLKAMPGIHVISKDRNEGYGAALRSAFQFAIDRDYEAVVTIDSDGQHGPDQIPEFFSLSKDWDIVSGSRYLKDFSVNTLPPKDRRRINSLITDQLNARLGLNLTDTFCGFKAYRVDAIRRMQITENGYGMPLELWVQAACLKLRIHELAVPLVYLDPNRSFGEKLDDADARVAYYQSVIDRALEIANRRFDCGLQRRKPVCVGADC